MHLLRWPPDTLSTAETVAKQSAAPTQSFVTSKSKHCIGRVTCDLGKGWDIEITFKNCTEAKFTGVELHPTSSRTV